ncbi:hypothetical protein PVL29_006340 [Vitis rotundifolia]|uniref:Uncharacterized protein n=1 Tax=Vitis rotundifolia TaxID=103349 RepID=A0AA39A6U7_VITRO|nr:hypothetical protein PVL29_006340 [Vitis rotundifolia]
MVVVETRTSSEQEAENSWRRGGEATSWVEKSGERVAGGEEEKNRVLGGEIEEENRGRESWEEGQIQLKEALQLPINDEGEFRKWQKEVREAEALKNGSISGGAGGDFGRDAGCFKAARELAQ